MAIDWLKNFIIPLIKVTFLLGICGFIFYYFYRAFSNAWKKSVKWFWKYKIKRMPYPEHYVQWIMNCLERRINWYDAKKRLMVKMIPDEQVNEILWIYMQMINIYEKGGVQNGRKFEGCDRKDQGKPTTTAELPSI